MVSGLGRWERYREYHYAPPTSFLVVLTTISTWRYRGIVVSWQWELRVLDPVASGRATKVRETFDAELRTTFRRASQGAPGIVLYLHTWYCKYFRRVSPLLPLSRVSAIVILAHVARGYRKRISGLRLMMILERPKTATARAPFLLGAEALRYWKSCGTWERGLGLPPLVSATQA